MSDELDDHVGELVSVSFGLVPDFLEPRILSCDITPLIANGTAFKELMQILGERCMGKIDATVGLEPRGFTLGTPLTTELGIGMLTIRKTGKLPGHVIDIDYVSEYRSARIKIRPELVTPGVRVFTIDDVLATGDTAGAPADLLR